VDRTIFFLGVENAINLRCCDEGDKDMSIEIDMKNSERFLNAISILKLFS